MEIDGLLYSHNETELNKHYINQAVSFICDKLSIDDVNKLNCKIKVSDSAKEEYCKIHFMPRRDEFDGTTIPPIFQSDDYKKSIAGNLDYENKTVIIINKRCFVNDDILGVNLISVVIHELSHCADYVFNLPKFQERYGFELMESQGNKRKKAQGGYYTSYSEVRAKYWQEMFLVENYQTPSFYKRMIWKSEERIEGKKRISQSFNHDASDDEKDYSYAQYVAGTIRCWEDAFINHPVSLYCTKEIEGMIKAKKDKYLCNKDIKDMYELWDWDEMIRRCDEIP